MEASARSTEPTELGAGSGDEITSKEEPGTAEQSIEDNTSGPDFSPNWRFYLAFASLCVVTLAVCILRLSLATGTLDSTVPMGSSQKSGFSFSIKHH
jgi:hypothetical protein